MGDIRFVRVAARPTSAAPEFAEMGGAFVNIYTTVTSEAEALALASTEIAEANWVVVSIEETYLLSRDDASPEALPYYDQAVLDGVVLVFHTYPQEGEEADVLH
jgi:molybdopterin biosynthesis enzyme